MMTNTMAPEFEADDSRSRDPALRPFVRAGRPFPEPCPRLWLQRGAAEVVHSTQHRPPASERRGGSVNWN